MAIAQYNKKAWFVELREEESGKQTGGSDV